MRNPRTVFISFVTCERASDTDCGEHVNSVGERPIARDRVSKIDPETQ